MTSRHRQSFSRTLYVHCYTHTPPFAGSAGSWPLLEVKIPGKKLHMQKGMERRKLINVEYSRSEDAVRNLVSPQWLEVLGVFEECPSPSLLFVSLNKDQKAN